MLQMGIIKFRSKAQRRKLIIFTFKIHSKVRSALEVTCELNFIAPLRLCAPYQLFLPYPFKSNCTGQ